MNSKLLVLMAALITFLLSGCCTWCVDKYKEKHVNQCVKSSDTTDPFESVYQGDCLSRIWVVDETGPHDTMHLLYGAAFKIERDGNKLFFRPLSELRLLWGINDTNARYELTITGEDKPRLCTKDPIALVNHVEPEKTEHIMLFEVLGPNSMDIEYEVYDSKGENQCTRRSSHGGMAHVEN